MPTRRSDAKYAFIASPRAGVNNVDAVLNTSGTQKDGKLTIEHTDDVTPIELLNAIAKWAAAGNKDTSIAE